MCLFKEYGIIEGDVMLTGVKSHKPHLVLKQIILLILFKEKQTLLKYESQEHEI